MSDDPRGFFPYLWYVMKLRTPPAADKGSRLTPYARRKLAQRAKIGMIAGRLLHREVIMRFHSSDSCGGHILPAGVFASTRDCPDDLRDLAGRNLREGGQQ